MREEKQFDFFKVKSAEVKPQVVSSRGFNIVDAIMLTLFVVATTYCVSSTFKKINSHQIYTQVNPSAFNEVKKKMQDDDIFAFAVASFPKEKYSRIEYQTTQGAKGSFTISYTGANDDIQIFGVTSDYQNSKLTLTYNGSVKEDNQTLSKESLSILNEIQPQHFNSAYEQLEQTDNIMDSVKKTQKLWGNAYAPLRDALVKYDYKFIDVSKFNETYQVKAFFTDNQYVESSYNDASVMHQSYSMQPGDYTLRLFVVSLNGKKELIVKGDDTMISDDQLEQSQLKQDILPELSFAMSKGRQKLMWSQLNDYTQSTYSKDHNTFVVSKAYQHEAQLLMDNIIDSMSSASDNAIYYQEKAKSMAMLNYVKAQGVLPTRTKVCRIYHALGHNLHDDELNFLNKAINGEVKKAC